MPVHDDLHIDRHAVVERIALAPSSWVEIVRGFVRDAPAVFTELHKTLPWQQTDDFLDDGRSE